MPTINERFPQIATLNSIEREELIFALSEELFPTNRLLNQMIHRFANQDFPSIVRTPSVCGGAARLIRTRIPVWTLEQMRRLGVSEMDILKSYPTLKAADLVQAWSYVDRHKDEIDQAIHENEE